MRSAGILAFTVGLAMASCNLINPVEPTPAYVHIPSIELTTDYVDEGSASHSIVDAWVYVDNQVVGVFELPAEFPVLETGSKIQVFPGIKQDGISNTRIPYPFYEVHEQQYSLQPATIDTISPSIRYRSGVMFPLKEDFEIGNDFTEMGITSAIGDVFEGDKSGFILLDAGIPDFVASSQPYPLPGNGSRVFLEMDYRNEGAFNVLLLVNASSGPDIKYVITINPKDDWNKIYIDLTSAVSSNPATSYQVVFAGELPQGKSEAAYYWDNIKLVHF
jgi:hypothetical protein